MTSDTQVTSPKILALMGVRAVLYDNVFKVPECRACAVDASAPFPSQAVGALALIGANAPVPLCRLCLIQAANEISAILEKL